jgi:tetratricopeptide (TPR) repeat protein
MTDQVFLSLIRFNNRGLEYLERRRYEDAIFVFTQALSSILTKEGEALGVLAQEDMINNTVVKDACYDVLESNEEDCDYCFVEMKLQCLDSEAAPSYVFTSPIMILEESSSIIQERSADSSSSSSSSSSMSAVKISVILTFNLALAHHFKAIESNSMDAFERALRLYELVHQIQMQEDVELCFLHSLALANNLGHVHLALNNTHKSKQCFEHLLATLMYFVEGGECEKDHDTMQGFFKNIIPLILKEKVVAAAA